MRRQMQVWGAIVAALWFVPVAGWAQSVQSGSIAGVARDDSGAVLPGVTVEASSPALIEKVRSATTDSQGVFRIIDLRPGVYSVTFTLPGFSTFRREGVELTAGFTATVNATMGVGALEETITVSGAAPIVDTQNIIQQRVISREVRDALPLSANSGAFVTIIPGATQVAANQDVGGTKGENTQQFTVHGSRVNDFQQLRDGMFFGTMVAAGNFMSSINPTAVQEFNVLTAGGLTAESETGGAQINVVPRDGGNLFHGAIQANFGHKSLQADNLDDDLRARGATTPAAIKRLYEVAGGFGGPLKQDTLWFFGSARSWITNSYIPGNFYNATQGTLFYAPDFARPAYEDNFYNESTVRLTWQAAQKHKITGMFSTEYNCNCNFGIRAGNIAPEVAGDDLYWPNWRTQVAWSNPASNRLLFEAGLTVVDGLIVRRLTGGTYDDISVLDLATNYRYGSAGSALGLTTAWGDSGFGQFNTRLTSSYVTGSHAFKTGLQYRQGYRTQDYFINQSMSYTFRGRVPQSVTFWASPYATDARQRTVALFAQDQWTVGALTLNLGVRYDYLNGWIPEQHLPAGPFVPERNFPRVDNALGWTDLSPRLGAAYDLFGTGRTALKAFLGRYVSFQSNAGVLGALNPVDRMITSSTRTWTDANGDYVPQDNELGPHSAANFGQLRPATTYDDAVLHGFGVREYSWQASVSMQHELQPGLAVNVGYFRTWYGNLLATDNRAITAADFDEYCIVTPADSRLPGGGGQQVCGLYDIRPDKFGQIDNFVTHASSFGSAQEVFNGVDVTFTARFGAGAQLSGGVATGKTLFDSCDALVDSPQQRGATLSTANSGFCRATLGWGASTQVKLTAIYPLPWDFRASGTYQNIAGIPTTASFVVNSAAVAPTLGRPLSGGGNATATIELVEPNTFFTEGRNHTVNVRLTRRFGWKGATIEPQFDVYNLLNANDVLVMTTRYGTAWQNVSNVLAPRLLKFGVQVNF